VLEGGLVTTRMETTKENLRNGRDESGGKYKISLEKRENGKVVEPKFETFM
jgi:hypothetical protein